MSNLPRPTGYRILIEAPETSEHIAGSMFVKPVEMKNKEEPASMVVKVLAMGDDCYADKTRFPHGPWCKVGDWVMIRSYSGSRFLKEGKEYRIIHDDTVDAVVDGPDGYSKI